MILVERVANRGFVGARRAGRRGSPVSESQRKQSRSYEHLHANLFAGSRVLQMTKDDETRRRDESIPYANECPPIRLPAPASHERVRRVLCRPSGKGSAALFGFASSKLWSAWIVREVVFQWEKDGTKALQKLTILLAFNDHDRASLTGRVSLRPIVAIVVPVR